MSSKKKKGATSVDTTSNSSNTAKLTSFFSKSAVSQQQQQQTPTRKKITAPTPATRSAKNDEANVLIVVDDEKSTLGAPLSGRASRTKNANIASPASTKSPVTRKRRADERQQEKEKEEEEQKEELQENDAESPETASEEVIGSPSKKRRMRGRTADSKTAATSHGDGDTDVEMIAAADEMKSPTKRSHAIVAPSSSSGRSARKSAPSSSSKQKALTEDEVNQLFALDTSKLTSDDDDDDDAADEDYGSGSSKKTRKKSVNATVSTSGSTSSTTKPAAAVPSSGNSQRSTSSTSSKQSIILPSSTIARKLGLSFVLPKRVPEVKIGDPIQLLTNQLQASEFTDYHENFHAKMHDLSILLSDSLLDLLWSPSLLIHLFLQLQMSFLHVQLPRDALRTHSYLPILPPIEQEMAEKPWRTNQVAVMVGVMSKITDKLEACLLSATATSAAPASTSSTANLFPSVTKDRLRTIVQLFLVQFSNPIYFGSCAPNSPPTPAQQSQQLLFTSALEFLHVVIDPILKHISEKDVMKVKEWLLKVIRHETKQKMNASESKLTRKESIVSASALRGGGESKSNEALADGEYDTIRSTITCCQHCQSMKKSNFLPYLHLSSLAQSSLNLFVRIMHQQGMNRDTVTSLNTMLREHLPDYTTQLSFMAAIEPPTFRVYCIALFMTQLFDKMSVTNVLFSTGHVGLASFTYNTEWYRTAHTHAFLTGHFEFLLRLLMEFDAAYSTLATTERNRLSGLEKHAKQAGRDAATKYLWTSPKEPAASSAASQPSSSPTITSGSSLVQSSVSTLFVKQQIKATRAATKPDTKDDKDRKAEEHGEAVRLEKLAQSVELSKKFRLMQQHYANLLNILIRAVSIQMHTHCLMHHSSEESDGINLAVSPSSPTSTQPTLPASSSAAGATLAILPHSQRSDQEADVCIPESQDEDDELAVSMTDEHQPAATAATSVSQSASQASVSRSASQVSASISISSPASSPSKASSHTQSKHQKKRHKVIRAPLACTCKLSADLCRVLNEKYRALHQLAHEIQAKVYEVKKE